MQSKAKRPITKKPSDGEVARLILVTTVSLCLIALTIGYIFIRDVTLLAADTIVAATLAAIVAYYFTR